MAPTMGGPNAFHSEVSCVPAPCNAACRPTMAGADETSRVTKGAGPSTKTESSAAVVRILCLANSLFPFPHGRQPRTSSETARPGSHPCACIADVEA